MIGREIVAFVGLLLAIKTRPLVSEPLDKSFPLLRAKLTT